MIADGNAGAVGAGPRLLADIGGTNARFAWQGAPGAPIASIRVYPCLDHASLQAAAQRYLADAGHPAPVCAAIAIANPVTADRVKMTNHDWSFSVAELRAALGLQRLVVLNDFTALALALPSLATEELRQVGGGSPVTGSAVALIGPGTGLGVSGLVPDARGGLVPLQGEGGHATLAGRTSREQQVLDELDARYGHASAERAVCGQGVSDIDAILQAADAPATPVVVRSAADIVQRALEQRDASCLEAINLFCGFLGTAAGNLALTLGARGGVYIGGGIVPRLGKVFEQSPFRTRFDAKGRFRHYLAAIPVYVIEARESPALRGAAVALDNDNFWAAAATAHSESTVSPR